VAVLIISNKLNCFINKQVSLSNTRVIVGNLGTCGDHDIIAVKMVFLQVCPPMLLDLLAKVFELGRFGLSMSALARAKKLAKSLWAMTN